MHIRCRISIFCDGPSQQEDNGDKKWTEKQSMTERERAREKGNKEEGGRVGESQGDTEKYRDREELAECVV